MEGGRERLEEKKREREEIENLRYTKILLNFDLSVGADFSQNNKLPRKLTNSNLADEFGLSVEVALNRVIIRKMK